MTNKSVDRDKILVSIREAAKTLGHSPSRAEFRSHSGMSEYHILKHFQNWRDAVRAAGLLPNEDNLPLNPEALLQDWGEMVRRERSIPTRAGYRRVGKYSAGTFEKKFGPWSNIPSHFMEYAKSHPEWADVVELIPPEAIRTKSVVLFQEESPPNIKLAMTVQTSAKLENRPTYGNPIDFRGLRHEPVNEQGVVFLFGMVARELGYLVEAIQTGYPDCEAKRQVAADRWQPVRIEFEYESRNFRDHGHSPSDCDIIICWKHNWKECPSNIEVVELSQVIKRLSPKDE